MAVSTESVSSLLIEHCDACARWVHPPAGECRECGGPLVARAVSGHGTVFTYTVNHHPYNPEIPTPYVIAIVELAEQSGLRVAANIVGCEPDSVRWVCPSMRGPNRAPVARRCSRRLRDGELPTPTACAR